MPPVRPPWVGGAEESVNDVLREDCQSSETLRLSSVASASVDAYIEYKRIVGDADGGVLLSGAECVASCALAASHARCRGGVRSLPRASGRACCQPAVRDVAQRWSGAGLQGARRSCQRVPCSLTRARRAWGLPLSVNAATGIASTRATPSATRGQPAAALAREKPRRARPTFAASPLAVAVAASPTCPARARGAPSAAASTRRTSTTRQRAPACAVTVPAWLPPSRAAAAQPGRRTPRWLRRGSSAQRAGCRWRTWAGRAWALSTPEREASPISARSQTVRTDSLFRLPRALTIRAAGYSSYAQGALRRVGTEEEPSGGGSALARLKASRASARAAPSPPPASFASRRRAEAEAASEAAAERRRGAEAEEAAAVAELPELEQLHRLSLRNRR